MRRVLLLVLVGLVAFALGWVAKGGREKSASDHATPPERQLTGDVVIVPPGGARPVRVKPHMAIADGKAYRFDTPAPEGETWLIHTEGGAVSVWGRGVTE